MDEYDLLWQSLIIRNKSSTWMKLIIQMVILHKWNCVHGWNVQDEWELAHGCKLTNSIRKKCTMWVKMSQMTESVYKKGNTWVNSCVCSYSCEWTYGWISSTWIWSQNWTQVLVSMHNWGTYKSDASLLLLKSHVNVPVLGALYTQLLMPLLPHLRLRPWTPIFSFLCYVFTPCKALGVRWSEHVGPSLRSLFPHHPKGSKGFTSKEIEFHKWMQPSYQHIWKHQPKVLVSKESCTFASFCFSKICLFLLFGGIFLSFWCSHCVPIVFSIGFHEVL